VLNKGLSQCEPSEAESAKRSQINQLGGDKQGLPKESEDTQLE